MKNLNESERSIFLKLYIIPAASVDQHEETTKQECIGLYEERRRIVDTTSAAISYLFCLDSPYAAHLVALLLVSLCLLLISCLTDLLWRLQLMHTLHGRRLC